MKEFLKENKGTLIELGIAACFIVAVYELGMVHGYLKLSSDVLKVL